LRRVGSVHGIEQLENQMLLKMIRKFTAKARRTRGRQKQEKTFVLNARSKDFLRDLCAFAVPSFGSGSSGLG
jgi:hypothetical protein